jgi:hypothetical protein
MWYLKQLVPLTYRSHYLDTEGNKRFDVWKMWMGRCYKIETFYVSDCA